MTTTEHRLPADGRPRAPGEAALPAAPRNRAPSPGEPAGRSTATDPSSRITAAVRPAGLAVRRGSRIGGRDFACSTSGTWISPVSSASGRRRPHRRVRGPHGSHGGSSRGAPVPAAEPRRVFASRQRSAAPRGRTRARAPAVERRSAPPPARRPGRRRRERPRDGPRVSSAARGARRASPRLAERSKSQRGDGERSERRWRSQPQPAAGSGPPARLDATASVEEDRARGQRGRGRAPAAHACERPAVVSRQPRRHRDRVGRDRRRVVEGQTCVHLAARARGTARTATERMGRRDCPERGERPVRDRWRRRGFRRPGRRRREPRDCQRSRDASEVASRWAAPAGAIRRVREVNEIAAVRRVDVLAPHVEAVAGRASTHEPPHVRSCTSRTGRRVSKGIAGRRLRRTDRSEPASSSSNDRPLRCRVRRGAVATRATAVTCAWGFACVGRRRRARAGAETSAASTAAARSRFMGKV